MSYRSTYFKGCRILQDDLYYRKTRLTGQVLQDRSYWCVCIIEGHALLKGMTYRWKCLTGVHVLCEDMYY